MRKHKDNPEEFGTSWQCLVAAGELLDQQFAEAMLKITAAMDAVNSKREEVTAGKDCLEQHKLFDGF